MMRKADLPRRRRRAPTSKARVTDCVVRLAEGPCGKQRLVALQLAELVLETTEDNPEKWVAQVWFRMLGRPATEQETAESLRLLKVLEEQAAKRAEQGLQDLPPKLAKLAPARASAYIHTSLALFKHNEFSFVE